MGSASKKPSKKSVYLAVFGQPKKKVNAATPQELIDKHTLEGLRVRVNGVDVVDLPNGADTPLKTGDTISALVPGKGGCA